jgi:HAD superfamily hydrolase (TIGR01509 family)
LSESEVFAHGAAKEALYREMIQPQMESKLVPGIREFLQRYSDVPTGIGSNAEPANVACVLEHAGLKPFFEAVVDGDQVERPKPFPDIYLRAAELLGMAPADCVVFEDSLTGVSAALDAGTQVVGLLTTCDELPGVALSIRDFRSPELDAWLLNRFACA